MKYAITIPLGMLTGFLAGSWLTGHSMAGKTSDANLQAVVLLAFLLAGGIASALITSSRWWGRRRK